MQVNSLPALIFAITSGVDLAVAWSMSRLSDYRESVTIAVGEPEPTNYWLSTLSARISRRPLVNITKLRWRIERDYQDLKQELGLGPYGGRGWRGFQHHATICIAAYGFLIIERAALPPSGERLHRIPPDISTIRQLSTQRQSRSGLNVMSVTQSPRCVASSPGPSHEHSFAVRAASR